ncbi:phage protein [Paenibacillus algicola]|uniref:ATP-dependent Clp protease proteolytic subunit n=2 Tax=Paenibacillus algicola TaxID=2565926 RepID=A0A4V1G486_9BACL|nr:phage protein [Paenibacillus algicola]
MPKKIKLNGPVIGDGSAWLYDWLGIPYIGASKLSKELDAAGGGDVELYINSGGGSVFAGSEVYTLLKEYPGKVSAKITGVAASAASYIALAADDIRMAPLAQFMIHNAAIVTDGDKRAHTGRTNLLAGVDESLINVYMKKSGKTREELADLMDSETWMNAQKAVELGFADGILFEEEELLSTATNSFNGEISSEAMNQIRDIMINNMLKDGTDPEKLLGSGGPLAGLDLKAFAPEASDDVKQVENSAETASVPKNIKEQPKEEEQPMKLEELKAQHPDLYNEVVNLGVTQERGRITELNALATAPGAAEIVAKAISEGKTAGETAMEIVKASAERVANEGTRRNNDAQNSGVGNVDSDEAPGKPDPEAVSKAEADALTAEINNMIGGRK